MLLCKNKTMMIHVAKCDVTMTVKMRVHGNECKRIFFDIFISEVHEDVIALLFCKKKSTNACDCNKVCTKEVK